MKHSHGGPSINCNKLYLILQTGPFSEKRSHASASSGFWSLPCRSARAFIITKKTGTKISTLIVEVIMPPTIGAAMGFITSDPPPFSVSGLSIRRSAVRSSISLSRAARELFHILTERLRGELQALDHSKIGEELIREILHGHARANGNRCGLNEFARFRRYHLRADQPARPCFGHQFDEALRVEIGQCARHVVERQHPALRRNPILTRLYFVIADGCYLRARKHHCRHRRQVESGRAAQHVYGRAATAGCRHVNELWQAGAVAGRINVGGGSFQ